MGAWGAGSFENDNALDWVWELEESADDSVLRAALAAGAEPDGYLEAPDAANALAAAEVVAAAIGAPGEGLPDEVERWVAAHGSLVRPDLVDLARRSTARVTADDSELRDLWEEAEPEAWNAAVADLVQRLGAGGNSGV